MMTAKEAADYMGTSPSTLAKLRLHGKNRGPKFYKIGTHIRFKREDLDAWMNSTAVETGKRF